jgi:serine/threonine protein phosphatase PrpC
VDDLMPIGEFSRLSGLSPKRLRAYAAAGLLIPTAVDSASGYRYYAPGQLRDAQLIESLRRAGVPLAEIGDLLRSPSEERLDSVTEGIQKEAADRRAALEAARLLFAFGGYPQQEQRKGKEAMTTLKTALRTECGPARENNEDAVVCNDRLAAVADGMGGHPGGEVAAGLAVALVAAGCTGRSLDELEAALRAANRAIWERANSSPGLQGMGTTICALGLRGDGQLAIVNMGDSRAYLVRHETVTQLTDDHSWTAELVRRGELGEGEAQRHPQRGVLTRALGVGPDVVLDAAVHTAEPGDRLLLCTDGLFNELALEEVRSLMIEMEDLQGIADQLVESALARGGRDNVSVAVVELCA